MPGGRGNIRPEDGKQFQKGNKAAEKWTEERALKLGNDLIEWMNENDDNMFFEEFLLIEKDLYEEIISYLCKKFTSFLKLIKKAQKIQEIKLKKFGVQDRLNASMTKFTLINNHGWKDRIEQDVKQESSININLDGKSTDEIVEMLEKMEGKDD